MHTFARNRPAAYGVKTRNYSSVSISRPTARQIRLMAEGDAAAQPATEQSAAEQPAAEGEVTQNLVSKPAPQPIDPDYIPVLREDDLQKGQRKELEVIDQQVVLFWYRNELFAVQSRSPSEGAYSVGFVAGTFTQDYGIRCPTTGSVFSLKTGECLSWFPDNAFLRTINPQGTRRIEIYPTKIQDGVIYVNTSGSRQTLFTKGGAETSLTGDDVYSTEGEIEQELPGRDLQGNRVMDASSWSILIATSVGISIVALVGVIVGSFLEDNSIIIGGLVLTAVALGAFYTQFFKPIDMGDLKVVKE